MNKLDYFELIEVRKKAFKLFDNLSPWKKEIYYSVRDEGGTTTLNDVVKAIEVAREYSNLLKKYGSDEINKYHNSF